MPSSEKRTFSLPSEQAGYIDTLVASGTYGSGSEVVRAAFVNLIWPLLMLSFGPTWLLYRLGLQPPEGDLQGGLNIFLSCCPLLCFSAR
jgi:antitoxin ParD1/3/4